MMSMDWIVSDRIISYRAEKVETPARESKTERGYFNFRLGTGNGEKNELLHNRRRVRSAPVSPITIIDLKQFNDIESCSCHLKNI